MVVAVEVFTWHREQYTKVGVELEEEEQVVDTMASQNGTVGTAKLGGGGGGSGSANTGQGSGGGGGTGVVILKVPTAVYSGTTTGSPTVTTTELIQLLNLQVVVVTMVKFAKIGLNNKVIDVVTVNEVLLDANGNEDEVLGVQFLTNMTGLKHWVQTSFEGSIRKNYAGIGYEWDEDRNVIEPKPKNEGSWVLDETTCRWKRPVDNPDSNGLNYTWDEDAYQRR